MSNLNTAVLGVPGYAKEVGKLGTETDITLYDIKRKDVSVSLLEPTRYPAKLAVLFYTLSMSQCVVLVVEDIDATLGEMILAVDAFGIDDGMIVLTNYVIEEQIEPLIEGTVLEQYPVVEDDPTAVRTALLSRARARPKTKTRTRTKIPPRSPRSTGSVPIDHAFHVHGVGPVVLGNVVSGSVHRHDELVLYPLDKTVTVRSIQKHDDDHKSAMTNDRVGLALKSVTVDDLVRGYVLSSEPLRTVTDLHLFCEPNRFWKRPIAAGDVLHIGHWMQFSPARVLKAARTDRGYLLRLTLNQPFVLDEAPALLVTHLDAGKLRVAGMGREAG